MPRFQDRLKLRLSSLIYTMTHMGTMPKGDQMSRAPTAPAGRIYGFTMRTIEGKDKPLAGYKGKVLLVVNTASECGFTPQYESLQAVHLKYADRGLRVLGFPANEFGAQEPGSDAQILRFCSTRYSVTFDLFSKIVVKGADMHPLYRFLTTESGFPGEIPWNFSKFLVSRDGQVAARFGPQTDPMGKSLIAKIEELLAF